MWTFLILVAATVLLHFAIPWFSADYGSAVQARFVERLKTIPVRDGTVPFDFANFGNWIAANPQSARGYACPILFPLDFVFMFTLGGALGCGSAWIASGVFAYPSWIWWIIPSIYVVADFVEDILLVRFLRNPAKLTTAAFSAMSLATGLKIKSIFAAFALLILLVAIRLCFWWLTGG